MMDKKDVKSGGFVNVADQKVGVEKSSVILDLDGQQSGKKEKGKKTPHMKSSYTV